MNTACWLHLYHPLWLHLQDSLLMHSTHLSLHADACVHQCCALFLHYEECEKACAKMVTGVFGLCTMVEHICLQPGTQVSEHGWLPPFGRIRGAQRRLQYHQLQATAVLLLCAVLK